MPALSSVPEHSFLASCKDSGAFTDCYTFTVPGNLGLAEFIEAFYTTRLFKTERWLLAKILACPSSDNQVRDLAYSAANDFSAWRVEQRSDREILLAFGQTRSWLYVEPLSETLKNGETPATRLYFGSAVFPARTSGKFSFLFHALGGFHHIYSRCLLAAAAKRIQVIGH
ncbi:MAG: hypothetical protein COB09_09450 [Thalassobium sp.]|nr:MAG: hypothetical protein COB09_09450 [Thalassobium sp.]